MVQRESGGNPRAVNHSDDNARAGHPSGGLMQMIEPTFESHWRPGTERNLFNPISSVAAAVHYVMTRYHVSADGANLMSNVQQANPFAAPKGY
jgi:SLT domain-containing protein